MLRKILALIGVASLLWCQVLEEAKRAFDKGDYGAAERLFEQARLTSPGCDIHFYLGLTQYRLKQPDAALISFESAVQCDPKLIDAHLALGDAYAERGNQAEALAAYTRVLQLDPKNRDALTGAARIHLRTRANQQAIELLEALVTEEPKDADAHADLAAAYAASGDRERATRQYQAALRIQPEHPSALMGQGNLLLKNGEEDRALELLQKASQLATRAFEPRYLLGTAYNRLGRYQEALDALQSAVRLGGGNESEVYYHLARAYGGLGRLEERGRALARFQELTRKAKQDTAAQHRALELIEEAKVQVEAGNLHLAAARLEEAREGRPLDDALLFRLASVNYDLQRNDLARSYAQEAIGLKPSEWLYHYLLGLIEKRSGRWAQARTSLETAARLNASAAEVHNALGELALQERDTQRAIESFKRATQLDPKEPAYKINLDAARKGVRQ